MSEAEIASPAARHPPARAFRPPRGDRLSAGGLRESEVPTSSLKPALEVLDQTPLIDPATATCATGRPDYYHHPPGDVYSACFPSACERAKHCSPVHSPGKLTARGKGLPSDALPRSPRQAEAIELLRQNAAIVRPNLKHSGISTAVLRSLREKDLIEPCCTWSIRAICHQSPRAGSQYRTGLGTGCYACCTSGVHLSSAGGRYRQWQNRNLPAINSRAADRRSVRRWSWYRKSA